MAIESPPTLDTVVAISDTEIQLDWTPAGDGMEMITGYKIERNLNAGGWAVLVADTMNAMVTYTDNTLMSGDQADYRVSTINASGTSDPSNVLGATTWTVPDAPVMSLDSFGLTNVVVDWTAPDDGGDPIVSYTVEASDDNFMTINFTDTVGPAVLTKNFTGLTNGVEYKFRVRATNSVGDSANSNVVTQIPSTAPAAPVLDKDTVTGTSVELEWPEPADNGQAITGYTVQTSEDALFSNPVSNNVAAGSDPTIYNKTGLVAGKQYWFRVRATNPVGDSAWSNVITVTTDVEPVVPASTNGSENVRKPIDRLEPPLILVDSDTMVKGCVLQTIGYSNVHLQITNTHGMNSLDYNVYGHLDYNAGIAPDFDTTKWVKINAMDKTVAQGATNHDEITSPYAWLVVAVKTAAMGQNAEAKVRGICRF